MGHYTEMEGEMVARDTLNRMAIIINKALDAGWGMSHGLQRAMQELVAELDREHVHGAAAVEDIGEATLAITELDLDRPPIGCAQRYTPGNFVPRKDA